MYGDSIATRVYRATLRLLLGALIPLAACVVSDALTGPGVAPVVLRYSGDTLLVVGDTVALALTAQVGGTPVAQSRFRYAIEDTTIVSQTTRGDSLVAKRRGRTRLTASLVSSVLPDPPPSVTVTLDAVVGAVTVTPAADTLRSLLDTLTLSAAALDAHGNPIAGVSPTWTSSDTSVAALVAPGRLVARGNGQATIRALVDGDTGTASVVVAQRIARLRVSPGVLALSALTAESTLVATALDARDNAIPGVAVTWTSSALSIATVTVGGRVRAVDNGTALIQATSGLVRDTATVVVEQQANRVVISPDPVAPITALGDQQFFTASATDSLGFVVTVPNKAAGWATLDPAVVTVDRTGLVTGVGVGSGHIIAVMDAARDTAIVPVGDLPASVDVQPGAATLASVHDTLPVTVTVRNSRGNLIQNPAVVWRTSDASVVQVDTATRPLAIAMRAGTARVIATAGTVADTSVVTVTNAPAFIDITSSADTLTSLWDSLPVPVVVLNARGDTLGATSVEWWSQAPLVGTVSAAGLVVARDTGETLVQAKFGRASGDTLRDSIRVRVLNVPAAIALSDERDTLTALGQSVAYSGEVRNARGAAIAGYPIAWSSTNPAAVTVSTGGVATAVGFGSAMVIGQAASMADTVVNVVVNPTRLIVDNGVTITPRFGTRKRPYARIQDGVNAAEVDDTVFVRKGAAWYSETVALNRRVTLLGDDSAFALSVPRNPLLLPLVSHDTGAAGITAYTTATVVIKNLVLRHTFAGPALDARRADLRVSGFYVNPPGTGAGRIGGGIALDSSASSAATITDSDIRSVRGYGIRVRDASGVVVDRVTIETVDSVPGQEPGAGIRVLRGSGHTVRRAAVRGTHGPQILVDSSPSATLALNDLAGRQRLMVVRSSNGTTVQDNLFDTRPLGLNGEVFSGGTLFEWAGLEIQSSLQIMVTGNSFRDVARADQEPLNGIRFVDVRNPQSPFIGAQTFTNGFLGNRAGIRSERSFIYIQGSRFDSTLTAILGTESDVFVLQDDTLRHALRDRCLSASQALFVSATNSSFESCTVGAAHALSVTNGTLTVRQSGFLRNRGAVRFTGNTFTAQGNAVSGAGFSPAPTDTSTAVAALEVVAQAITVAQNTITGHRFNAGLRLQADNGTASLDSNFVTGNIRGIRFGRVKTFSASANDVFDNDIAGVVNEDVNTVSVPEAWWGDPRGPRGAADITATGDSLVGLVNADSRSMTPHSAGAAATALHRVRGDAQAAAAGTTLAKAFTIRVIDAAGRPVAGVTVTFQVTAGAGTFGGATTVTVTSNASGLAEATLTLDSTPGANTATATVPGLNTITFSATGT